MDTMVFDKMVEEAGKTEETTMVVVADAVEEAVATTIVVEEVTAGSMEATEASEDTMEATTTQINPTNNAVSCISSNQCSNRCLYHILQS